MDERTRAALIEGIYGVARDTGASPQDVATAISYETGGTFDPWKAGPTTKWGQHHGLIQWGEPQARQYGVSAATPITQQFAAISKYLHDRGYKSGMGLRDLYSTINAGRPGLYGASDGYGTVASHVDRMLKEHSGALAKLTGGAIPASGAPTPATSRLASTFAPEAPLPMPTEAEAPAPAATGPSYREEQRRALNSLIGQLFA